MIIARPIGGLANQMNVYAAARALAIHHGVKLKLDLSNVEKDLKREYELNKLNINAEIATKKEIERLKGKEGSISYKIKKEARRHGLNLGLYKEKKLTFDNKFFKLPDNIYISGNFHSVKYYAPIADILREEFSITLPLSTESEKWEDMITSHESVAVHIRRGDYANDKSVRKYHGLLNLEYYQRSIRLIEEKLKKPVFFIFSDDPLWVKNNLKTRSDTYYVNCNDGENAYQDFHLMRQCKHNIIANSGFSRWPAWLNNNPQKVVCMPQRWFREAEHLSEEDNAPLDWTRVENSFS